MNGFRFGRGDRSEPLVTPAFLWLSLAHLLATTSILGLTLLPLFIKGLGGDAFDIGLLMSVASVSGILVRPWIGRVMDRRGPGIVLALCGVVNVAGPVTYLGISSIGPAFHLARLIHGVGIGGLFAAFFTLATDLIPARRRTEGIAMFGISGMAGGGLGPFLGEIALSRGGFARYFWMLAVLAGASVVISLAAARSRRRSRHSDGPAKPGLERSLLSPALVRLWGVAVAFGVSIGSFSIFLSPYVESAGLGSVSPFFVTYAVTSIVLRLVFSHLPERVGLVRVVPSTLVALAAAAIVLVVDPSRRGLVIGGVLAGFGHGFAFPVLGALTIERSNPLRRGSAVSAFTSAIDFGVLLAGPALGTLARLGGYGAVFGSAAACAAAGAVSFSLAEKKSRAR